MTMRTIIMCLLALLMSSNALAQRLNALCQKMISHFEINVYNKPSKLTFNTDSLTIRTSIQIDLGYDCSDCLERLTFDNGYKTIKILKKGGTLTRTDYIEGAASRECTYRYKMDGTRIAKIETYDHATNGSNECIRYDLDFKYDYSYNDAPRLESITDTWYLREANTKTFVKREGQSARIFQYRLEEGNFNQSVLDVSNDGHSITTIPFKEGIYLYGENENDTNINWGYLVIRDYCTGSGSFDLPELFTEWVGLHSFNHLIGTRRMVYDLEYIYDEAGNMTEIKVYSGKSRWLYMEVSVSYVQE